MVTIKHLLDKHLLVIGGSGFIGKWVAKEGVNRGYKVTVLSLNIPDKEQIVESVSYLNADITDQNRIQKSISSEKFTHVVNLGGYINHAPYREGGRKTLDTHFSGLLNLVECLDWSILKSFVQIGSSDEYGDAPAPQREDYYPSPISSYSIGKAAATNFLQMLHRTEGFPAIILRFFLIYGPGQNKTRFLPQIILGCLENNVFPVSKGEQLRDFCYILDAVKAIFLSLESSNVYGEIFNIASGNPVSIRSVVQQINSLVGRGKPEFGAIDYRLGENMELYADVSKAEKKLGWVSEFNFEEGLTTTIDSYCKKV